MADLVLQAVATQREITTGEAFVTRLHEVIARFATAALYTRTAEVLPRIAREIARLTAKEFFPYAQAIGRQSARPLIEALKGRPITEAGLALRGRVLKSFRRFHRGNVLALRAELRTATGTLSGEIEAAFAKAYRDNVARRQLIADLTASHNAEMAQLRKARRRIKRAGGQLGDAEATLARASGRGAKKARVAVKAAQRELRLAKASVRNVKSFYARFETKVQASVRDAMRREAHEAEMATFHGQGYDVYTWITVNGSAACPDCTPRHGMTRKWNEWRGDGPGDGSTICGASCMCQLVPEQYRDGNPTLDMPLFRGRQAK